MGIRLFSSCGESSLGNADSLGNKIRYGNPNPSNFVVEKAESVGKFAVVKIYYPDCTNYEGRKILVYKNVGLNEIFKSTTLDPHFCNDKTHISPIARFEPTVRGWRYAISFCKSFKKQPTKTSAFYYQIKTKKKAKDIRITYKQAKIPKEEAQNILNRAFDILFGELCLGKLRRLVYH